MTKYPLPRKCLAIGIILLFVGTCIIPTNGQDAEITLPTSRGNWLYVGGSGPGNYTKIQDAINASSNGDTVFVYDDSSPYYENICINREIKVIGEDKNSTIIVGSPSDIVVKITANKVSLEQFTIWNITLSFNYLIWIGSFHGVLVRNNIIEGCGVYCHGSFCEFSNNFFCKRGSIISDSASYLFIHHNVFQGYIVYPIHLQLSKNCIISNNLFNDTGDAITLDFSFKNKIYDNTIMNNYKGIVLFDSFYNYIYRNSFIANGIHAQFSSNSIFIPIHNRWVRNYWDDIGVIHIKMIKVYQTIYADYTGVVGLQRLNFDWFPAQKPYDIPEIS
jgi:parallel beta-helix repeat protein